MLELLLVDLLQISATELPVAAAGLQHGVAYDQDAVRNRHNRPLHPAARGQSLELGRKVAVFLPCNGSGDLAQRTAQPFIAIPRRTGKPFAGTLVIAGTDCRPGSQVLRGRKLRHVYPDFCDQVAS